jgi:hypothetical protein
MFGLSRMLAALEALARAEDRPLSSWVRRALRAEVWREQGGLPLGITREAV